MRVKKIIAGLSSLMLVGALMFTTISASAAVVHKYNQDYYYDGREGEMGWTVKGTYNQAITTASNSAGSDTRYVYAYVACRNTDSKQNVGTPSSRGSETTNAGVAATIRRYPTNKKYYYYHQAYMKSSEDSSNLMAFESYTVYQDK